MSEKPGTNPESQDNTELEKLWGKDTTQLKPGVKEIIFSALKKRLRKLPESRLRSGITVYYSSFRMTKIVFLVTIIRIGDDKASKQLLASFTNTNR